MIDIIAVKRQDERYFVIQGTPVGQRSAESLLADFEWSADDVAADLVYNPLRTKFLDIAARHGAQTIDGLGMLIEQAALSQYFWMTGTEWDHSILSADEFNELHTSLSNLVTSRWDAFGT